MDKDIFTCLHDRKMAKRDAWFSTFAVAAATLAISLPMRADSVNFPGSTLTEVIGINNAGTVVGSYTDSSNVSHAFTDSGGVYTTIDNPAALAGTTQATGINNGGLVVGNYISGSVYHGFEESGGTFTAFSYPGANTSGTLVFGVNDGGDLAGQFSVTGGTNVQSFLFLKTINQYIIVSDPLAGTGAGQGTAATGVNNTDMVVGTYKDALGLTHGFVESGGIFTTLDDPNAVAGGTDAVGINNNGEVDGYFLDSLGHYNGFTELNGIYTTVNDPDPAAVNTQLFGINDSAQGAGIWADSSGNIHSSTIPTAVPEPATAGLLGIPLAIAGLAYFRRRRATVGSK